MARKRFTDADKWEDPWFCEQSSEVKLFWQYICDRCDLAGVWEINWKLAEFHLGKLDRTRIRAALGHRVAEMDGGKSWNLTGFIRFQYPNGLSLQSPVHRKITAALMAHGLDGYTTHGEGLGNPSPTVGPTVVEEEVEIEVDSISQRESAEREASEKVFTEFWNRYGKKVGKKETITAWAKLTMDEKYEALGAVDDWVKAKPDPQYRKDPVRFLKGRHWEDVLPTGDTEPTKDTPEWWDWHAARVTL